MIIEEKSAERISNSKKYGIVQRNVGFIIVIFAAAVPNSANFVCIKKVCNKNIMKLACYSCDFLRAPHN